MKEYRYQINLLPYKEVLKLCKKYFKKKEKVNYPAINSGASCFTDRWLCI